MSSFKPTSYGLQLRGAKAAPVKKPMPTAASLFDDSDDDAPPVNAKSNSTRPGSMIGIGMSKQKKQVEIALAKAVEEDPTVFQYDEIYDVMEDNKNQVEEAKKESNNIAKAKPKYISSLLKANTTRKMEEERRIERKIKKERENEGDEFNDKEAFVTGAYKLKMLEMQKAQEEERKLLAKEASDDVTKKSDLSGFYRNLLTHNVAMGAEDNEDTLSPVGGNERKGKEEREDKGIARERERDRETERDNNEYSTDEYRHNGINNGDRHSEREREGEQEQPMERKREEKIYEREERDKREREKEEKEAERKKYARRNDVDAVAIARAKALARRAMKKAPSALVEGDD